MPPLDPDPRSDPSGKAKANPIRDVVSLIAVAVFLLLALAVAWWITQSTGAFLAVGAVFVLVLILVFAFVAATTGIIKGTALERILLKVLEKIPVLSRLAPEHPQQSEKRQPGPAP
jgi:Na+/melibiose symporter-like transporter